MTAACYIRKVCMLQILLELQCGSTYVAEQTVHHMYPSVLSAQMVTSSIVALHRTVAAVNVSTPELLDCVP